jgi:hypothetical protein
MWLEGHAYIRNERSITESKIKIVIIHEFKNLNAKIVCQYGFCTQERKENLLFQNHNTAQYLDALNGSINEFPVKKSCS